MEQMSLNLETQSELGYLPWSHTTSTLCLILFLFSLVFVVCWCLIPSVSYFLSVVTLSSLSPSIFIVSLQTNTSSLSLYGLLPWRLPFFSPPSVSLLPFTDCLLCLATNPLLWSLDMKLQVHDNWQSNKQFYLQFSRHASKHQCLFRPGSYYLQTNTET